VVWRNRHISQQDRTGHSLGRSSSWSAWDWSKVTAHAWLAAALSELARRLRQRAEERGV